MKRAILLGVLLLSACAPTAFHAEAPAPDKALIARLLAAPARESKHQSKPASFELRAPRIALWGNTIALTCFVPESLGSGSIRLALEGVQIIGPRPLEHAQTTLLIPRIECGTWKATCQVAATGGSRYAEVPIEVKGGMCEDAR